MPISQDHSNVQIVSVPTAKREPALRLVFARLAEEQHQPLESLLAEVTEGETALLGAYRAEQLAGAVCMRFQPGRTAALWPPQLVPGEPPDTALRLIEAALAQLGPRGIRVVQALLAGSDPPEAAILREGGFIHLTDLFYLVAPDSLFPTSPPQTPLEFEVFSPASADRFERIVDATYRQTLDCPKLNGVRSAEDVLAGYRATGVFDPSRWLIARHAGADVGCLLVADHPRQGVCELVYMGLTPEARGHHWGIDLAQLAQWLARQAGRQRLVVAVDAANEPALRAYAAAGFEAWDRRAAFLKILP